MENAVDALVMIGKFLILLMILSCLALVFSNISGYQDIRVKEEISKEVVEFNMQYETYNRSDVRGNELYTLLNKAIDHNTRNREVGDSIPFYPIEIEFEIADNDKTKNYIRVPDITELYLFKKSKYKILEPSDNEHDAKSIMSIAQTIEKNYGRKNIIKLVHNMDKVKETDKLSDDEKKQIFQYYEFNQFKKLHFTCKKVEYDSDTHRINKMIFESTDKIE